MKKNLLEYLFIVLLCISFLIRDHKIYIFRKAVTILVIEYNDSHYYNQIRKVNEVMPSGYYQMLFSIKPLKARYWINRNGIIKFGQKNNKTVIT